MHGSSPIGKTPLYLCSCTQDFILLQPLWALQATALRESADLYVLLGVACGLIILCTYLSDLLSPSCSNLSEMHLSRDTYGVSSKNSHEKSPVDPINKPPSKCATSSPLASLRSIHGFDYLHNPYGSEQNFHNFTVPSSLPVA